MAEDQRAPRADPIDVAVPVDVDELEPLTARDEDRMLAADRAHRPDRRVHATRHQPDGTRINHLRRTSVGTVRHSSAHMGSDPGSDPVEGWSRVTPPRAR